MQGELASQRRQRYRDDTRRGLLDGAAELLVEEGLDALSMRRLAARCGCAAATIYHYFKDKTDLVDALLEERMRDLVAELEAVELAEDPVQNALILCVAFARFGLRNPEHYQLMMMNRGEGAEEPPSGEKSRSMLLAPLEALVRNGSINEPQCERLRQELWCLLHGYILLQTTRPHEEWVPDLLERSLESQLRGALRGLEAQADVRNTK